VLLNQNDSSGNFFPQSTFTAGDGANSVAVGDFDGDGAPDLAVANVDGNNVSVLLNLNDGSGGFGPQTTFVAGGVVAYAVAVGDFNGDGASDLVVAIGLLGVAGDDIAVLLNRNNGSGDFFPPTTYEGLTPNFLAVGDFNGDGAPDVVASNIKADLVSVWLNLNDGSGGFGAVTTYFVGGGNSSVAVGDLNSDGALDLAVSVVDEVSVVLNSNDGSGGFGSPTTFATGSRANSVAAADFNRDGALDLAVTNFFDNNVSVLLNLNVSFDADLLISQGVDKISVKQGELLTYTITVSNFGPYAALNTVVTDTLPSGSTFYSAQATKGTFTKPPVGQTGTVTWKMGTLQSNDVTSAQIKVTVIVRGPTSITNTASVATTSSDPNLANNSSALTVSVAKGTGKKR
jgi:uncharacterized repeat protein (TIGR01451 family)